MVGTELCPLTPAGGALERLACGWARGVHALGHDAFLVSCTRDVCFAPEDWVRGDRARGERDGPAAAPAWKAVALSREGLVATSRLSLEFPRSLLDLLRILAPDVTVLSNRPLWASLCPGAVVHVLHNWPSALDITSEAERIEASGLLEKGRCLAVSQALADAVSSYFGLAAVPKVLYPFIDPAFLDRAERPLTTDASRRVSTVVGRILFPNRLLSKKGVEVLLEAMEMIGAGWHAVLFDNYSPWSEPTAEHVRLRAAVNAAERALLVPAVSDPGEMALWYESASVAVVPSVEPEGLGLSALEAQAMRVPVVASAIGGLPEALHETNPPVPPGDARALVEAIRAASRRSASELAEASLWARRRFRLAPSARELARSFPVP